MKKMDIIYEDKHLLVVNKPAKLLTISDGKTDYTLYSMAREYVKKQHKANKIFIVHRLDKDTSGIVVFAKSERVKNFLQNNWNNIVKREYIAILEGRVEDKKGLLSYYLYEDRNHFVHVSNNKKDYLSQTEYEVLKQINNYTYVKINILTGRKNQIRASFSYLGYPIVGDKKYGSKSKKNNRLYLHAYQLWFKMNNREYFFETSIPKEFDYFTN